MAGEGRRLDHVPELRPAEVYRLLCALQADDPVPPMVYVADYADGTIPAWRVYATRHGKAGVVEMIAFDMSNTYTADGQTIGSDGIAQASLFGDTVVRYPAVRILSSQAKTLRSPIVEFSGPDAWPSILCSMLQQAKIATREKAEQEA